MPRKAHPLPLLTLLLALAACGPPDEPAAVPGAQPIINGTGCDEKTQPPSVGLLVDAKLSMLGASIPFRTILCTGTLIAPDVVLTAAHCVDAKALTGGMGALSEATYYASFAADLTGMVLDLNKIIAGQLPTLPAGALKAASAVAHPSFSMDLLSGTNFKGGLTNLYDVALVFLEKPVSSVQPAVLITKQEASQVVKSAKVLISGWGQQTAAPQNPFVPPAAGSVGKKICAESFINEVGTHEMQIGGDSSTSRKCHGDSGGPSYLTVQTNHTRKERVVGITSHAYDNTDCAKGGVDTRVDAWLDWLDQQMTKACDDKKRSWCTVKGVIPPSYYDPPPDLGVRLDGASPGDAAVNAADEAAGCDCALGRPAGPPWLLLLLGAAALLLAHRRR